MVRTALALCLLASGAYAQDPECLTPISRFDTIRCPGNVCELCTPREWTDDTPMVPGDLAGCLLTVAGRDIQVAESDPAILVPVTVPADLCGAQPASVSCTSAEGVESDTDTGTLDLDACQPPPEPDPPPVVPKKPKPPHFIVRS